MSIAITSSADRFSVNGLIFKDYINLKNVITISLCKDRYYSHFDLLFLFSLGTRNGSYTDEQILRVGHFPMTSLDKAGALIEKMLSEKEAIFDIDEALLDKEAIERRNSEIKKKMEIAKTQTPQAATEQAPAMSTEKATGSATSQTATEDKETEGKA